MWSKALPDTYIVSEYVDNNRTVRSIAKEFNVSESTISRHLKFNNITIRTARPEMSGETRMKISNLNRGRKRSDVFKRKITGEGNHQFGRKNDSSPAWRMLPDEQIASEYIAGSSIDALAVKNKCSFETISRHLRNLGVAIRSHSESITGNKNGRWNDGASFKPYCPKFNEATKEATRNKYNRICQKCHEPENGIRLDVHHINFDKQSGCYGKAWNLVPLHHHCHTWATNHRFEAFQLFANHWATNPEINWGYLYSICEESRIVGIG